MIYPKSLEKMIEEFEKFPGVGRKSAQRMAFFLLKASKSNVQDFLNSIVEAKRNLKKCSNCFNISDNDPCDICSNVRRDHTVICVVETVEDLLAMERTQEFKGIYHILEGSLSPINGVEPDDLRIKELMQRITNEKIEEIILATSTSITGETTATYLTRLLKNKGIRITRIAYGVPIGSELEYTDEITLRKAIEGRREVWNIR